jgi:hypothetical protein
VVVLPGKWPLNQAPVFADASGHSGAWGGQAFRNLLRNSSAETAWMRLRPGVDALGARILPDKGVNQPSVSLYYLLDTTATWPFQRVSAQRLFRTFWASFALGHVELLHSWSYWVILAAAVLGLAGAILAIWRLRKTFPWREVVFLGLALLWGWLQTFLRGANYPTKLWPIYYPTARYAYPVIIPCMLLLNMGWYELGRVIKLTLRLPVKALEAGYILAWMVFNLYGILSIASFYS